MITIHQGDCRNVLPNLAAGSVHCVVTSPPYFGLRDYGAADQIGLETSPADYVDQMVQVFRMVRRVLREDGTLWLNLGDSYNSNSDLTRNDVKAAAGLREQPRKQRALMNGLAAKQRLMIPARVALALQADGWWLRDEIVWSKPNPMPESVTDRCTKAHEMIYMLAKSPRYFYDAAAIAEPSVGELPVSRMKLHDGLKQAQLSNLAASTLGTPAAETRNRRSVWDIATTPYRAAHFATFPPALIEPCIKAGCPIGGTVLDPFGGAGTTGLVADRLQRNAVLIELNPEYGSMAERRIQDDAGLFADFG